MLNRAKEILESGGYTCVLYNGDAVFSSTQRGVRPLLQYLDSGNDFSGFVAADKVVGKAAAFLYVLLGIRAVYAVVLSRHAKKVFEKNGIEYCCDTLTESIRNRTDTGFCPMEQAVMNISSPTQAKTEIIKKLDSFNN